ncbi:MAG: DUF3106 domain-containing protein [Proteobacteria bacterium]|nr:DUF3106 domain-containing protein [Pseudomonadota bacterium]
MQATRVIVSGLLIGWCLLAAGLLSADDTIPWDALNADHQRVLEKMRGQWDDLDPARQRRLMEGAEAWRNMDPGQRRQARGRLKRWQSYSPGQKQKLRGRMKRFKSLPPEQRQRLRKSYQRFQSLPSDQRRDLRHKWQSMSAEQRRKIVRQNRRSRDNQRNLEPGRRQPRAAERRSDTGPRDGNTRTPQRPPRSGRDAPARDR